MISVYVATAVTVVFGILCYFIGKVMGYRDGFMAGVEEIATDISKVSIIQSESVRAYKEMLEREEAFRDDD